jgi:hypothetical protein
VVFYLGVAALVMVWLSGGFAAMAVGATETVVLPIAQRSTGSVSFGRTMQSAVRILGEITADLGGETAKESHLLWG